MDAGFQGSQKHEKLKSFKFKNNYNVKSVWFASLTERTTVSKLTVGLRPLATRVPSLGVLRSYGV